MILAGNATVPYVARRPNLPKQPDGPIPTSGNFTVRDEFDAPSLPPYWHLVRTPRERWYDIASGSLTLHARPFGLGPNAQPSLIVRRQQHMYGSATTAMHYRPTANGDKAGMVAMQSDRYYYFLAVARVNGQDVVQLEKHAGAGTGEAGVVIASVPIVSTGQQPVFLKIEARGPSYDFYFAQKEGEWKLLLGDADGRILSTHVAGGFVGTMFGLYAYSAPGQAGAH